jgi:two-component system, NtrC family, C4-dicarboxylate transport response regulator DctD
MEASFSAIRNHLCDLRLLESGCYLRSGLAPAMHSNPKNPAPAKIIFVVDDEQDLLDYEDVVLSDAGYGVRQFANPEAALAEFHEQRPMLVLTDYWMPRMSGMDLLRECRRRRPGQKVVLISGTVDQEVFAHAAVQPDNFMAKPFLPQQLLEVVERLIGKA